MWTDQEKDVFIIFFRCDDEIVWQEQLQGERAGFGSQFKDTGHHDWEVTAAAAGERLVT